jgi:phenylpropionate dioxygenase-like ring-hydroxylating dioxygenase large terminal subunit
MFMRAPFLKVRYGGYHHRDVPREDVELTHVGPGTACGEYMRRFWQPVCFSDELRDLPLRAKILGEDLVVFRDRSGTVGLLELHCPHRGASLEFGLIEDHGIRCCYHGWLFAADGAILETPGEPAGSSLKDRLCHGAYPTHEYDGIVFAYMGPPDTRPAFPIYDSFVRPGYRSVRGHKYILPCNWLQIMENAMDPAHTAFLHTIISGAVFTDAFGVMPELEFLETPVGMVYVATRRVEDNVWMRMVEAVLPNLQQAASLWEDGRRVHGCNGPILSRWIVPIDDTNTLLVELRHMSEIADGAPAWWTDGKMAPAQIAAASYEAAQRQPGDYEAQVSQRPIAVHGLEHLGATDRGVAMFRSQVRRGIKDVQTGQDPRGLSHDAGRVIPTYCNDTVERVPAGANSDMDRELMRKRGRELAEGYLKNPPLLSGQPARSLAAASTR